MVRVNWKRSAEGEEESTAHGGIRRMPSWLILFYISRIPNTLRALDATLRALIPNSRAMNTPPLPLPTLWNAFNLTGSPFY